MNWRESRDDSMVYHELWDGPWVLATAWEDAMGAHCIDHHGAVWKSPSLETVKRNAEERAKGRIRVEVA